MTFTIPHHDEYQSYTHRSRNRLSVNGQHHISWLLLQSLLFLTASSCSVALHGLGGFSWSAYQSRCYGCTSMHLKCFEQGPLKGPQRGHLQKYRVIIVGKIILDYYCTESDALHSADNLFANNCNSDDDDKEQSKQLQLPPMKETCVIGGGGPQAAWGAAAALAVRNQLEDMYKFPFNGHVDDCETYNDDFLIRQKKHHHEVKSSYKSTEKNTSKQWLPLRKGNGSPKQQPVTFLAPIGLKNWTPALSQSVHTLLTPVLDTPPVLISSINHLTPAIQIWHDDQQTVHWRALNGSFDHCGANGLWRDQPCATDILHVIQRHSNETTFTTVPVNDAHDPMKIVLHCILEAGSHPTGGGEDALFLFNSKLIDIVDAVGIEPVVFFNDDMAARRKNGEAVRSLVKKIEHSVSKSSTIIDGKTNIDDVEKHDSSKLLMVVPDRTCFEAAFASNQNSESDVFEETSQNYNDVKQQDPVQQQRQHDYHPSKEIIIRDGPNGSFLNGYQEHIPAATLLTSNNQPRNPTGAGNAYSAAYTACRATGSSEKEAAVIATAVGAVVCEYDHLPPWTWDVLERIINGVNEVWEKVARNEEKNADRWTDEENKASH